MKVAAFCLLLLTAMVVGGCVRHHATVENHDEQAEWVIGSGLGVKAAICRSNVPPHSPVGRMVEFGAVTYTVGPWLVSTIPDRYCHRHHLASLVEFDGHQQVRWQIIEAMDLAQLDRLA